MKKNFRSFGRPRRKSGHAHMKSGRPMKPGCDKSLKQIFKKIGVPASSPFRPDPFQLRAVKAVQTSDCLVTAPTGAGKTWIARKVAQQIVEQKGRVWYATPLKALTNSIHAGFSKFFGKNNVGILTGDIKDNTDASIVVGTTEILRNQLYDAMYTGQNLSCDMIILDEAHYLGDEQRGVVWEEIMIYLPVRVPLLLLSATIGNPHEIAGWLESIRGNRCKVIESHNRPVPLVPLFMHPSGTLFPLLQPGSSKGRQCLHKKVAKFTGAGRHGKGFPGKLPPFDEILAILDFYGLLPAIFFLKSRAECDQAVKMCSSRLMDGDFTKKQNLDARLGEIINENPHLENHRHLDLIRRTGTASHHSGHLPAWKVVVETLMAEGLLNAMFATSTVAAGVNFPARSVVILNSDRFNGMDFIPLTPSEFQQMTGRAGRRGMDKIGFGIVLPGRFMDLNYVAQLVNCPPSDIESRMSIDFSMVLNLLLSHSPEQIKLLLNKSFASYLIVSEKKRGKKLEFLWNDFLDHMDFLIDENFVTDKGSLTQDGLWASKLRIDSPLLVAQSIRKKLLPETDPALLAAIIAAFVNEKEFTDAPLYMSALPRLLKQIFLETRKGLKPFALRLLKNGFDAPNLYIQPAFLIYKWAHTSDWDSLVNRSGFAEGDLARLILRTGENLRQISKLDEDFPRIAENAGKAVHLILKEPVVTFTSQTD
jgi:superfamily II RNA helicase